MNLFAWFWSFSVVIAVLYTALIIWFLNGWKNIPFFKSNKHIFSTKVSVIVPFFNEEQNLRRCIESLLKQNIQTNEFEIILVDDQSDDESIEIAKRFVEKDNRVKYLRTELKGKKQAILLGVKEALGELIITTDADCVYKEKWLSTLVDYYEQHKPNMIVGPVQFNETKGMFAKFQKIESASLVATGAGAIGIGHATMCNGANLAFNKNVFDNLNDPLNLKYISGDDVFLLHKMKTIDNDKIHFIKSEDAIVETHPVKGLKSFFIQRKRWVSKAPGYNDSDTKFTAFVVFAASVLWLLGFVFMTLNIEFWKPALFLLAIKTGVDLFFMHHISGFFNVKNILKWTPVFQLFYGVYVLITGILLLLSKRS